MTAERRSAAWPWVLVPIIALAVFFCLRSCKEAPTTPQTEAVAG